MIGGHQSNPLIVSPNPAKTTDRSLVAQEGLGGKFAESHDNLRPYGRQLPDEERLARLDLLWKRITVCGRPAFFYVTDIDLLACHAHGMQNFIQQSPRFPYEGLPLFVLFPAWRFANKNKACMGVSHTKNDVLSATAQGTATTILKIRLNLIESFTAAHGNGPPLFLSRLQGAYGKIFRKHPEGDFVDPSSGKILKKAFCLRQGFLYFLFHTGSHKIFTTLPPWTIFLETETIQPMAFTAVLLSFLILLLPTEAFAWGVGVHLQLGSHILGNLGLLSAPVQALLNAYPNDYLYGCMSADITLGKKYTHYLKHCHSWRMGKNILEAARTDSQRACAYGYLSHLAADTVAHSYMVPFKMVRTFNTILLKHAYWELRFESKVDPEIWDLARTVARKNFQDNDILLRSVLSDTLFSFPTNKKLFNSLLLLNHLQQWQKMIRSLSTTSKWTLPDEYREEYLRLAREAIESILIQGEDSPYWKADPTGERAINAAKMIRKNLNLLWLDGKLPEKEADAIIAELRPQFREGITQPDQLLSLLSQA